MRVGFIGIGAMGKPMAINLLRAGYNLVINDLNEATVQELVAQGAVRAETTQELAQNTDVVITMLPNEGIVENILLSEHGVFSGANVDSTIIDMSSVSPGFSKRMAKFAEKRKLQYLDAPVSGGVKGATEGTLTIMIGGKAEVVSRFLPLFEVIGKKIFHVGDVGDGDAVKLVNNLLLGINMVAVAEAFALGVKMGLEPQALFDVINVSSGNSYALCAKMPNSVFKRDFSPHFTIDLQYKDLELATQSAKELKVPMLLANLAQMVFEQARAAGLGREDISAVIKPLEELLNIEVKA